jgi:hypothetical protein
MTIYPRARSSRMGEPPSYRSLPCPPGPRGVNAAAELRGQGSQPCEIRTESKISSPAAAYPRPAPVTAERSRSAASYRYAAAKPRVPRRRGHGRPTTPAGSRRGRWSANKCYSGRIKVFGHSAIYRIPKNLISETNLIYVGDQIFGRDGSIFHSFFDFFCKPD